MKANILSEHFGYYITFEGESMFEEKESFSSFVVEKYIDFHKSCENLTSQACLDKYEDYLRNRISLPAAAVHLSMQQLKESYLFKEGRNGTLDAQKP